MVRTRPVSIIRTEQMEEAQKGCQVCAQSQRWQSEPGFQPRLCEGTAPPPAPALAPSPIGPSIHRSPSIQAVFFLKATLVGGALKLYPDKNGVAGGGGVVLGTLPFSREKDLVLLLLYVILV